MPAWATIVLTLGSTFIGAAGALVGSWLQMRHGTREREQADHVERLERGAAALGPVIGVVTDLEPAAIAAAGRRRSPETMENIGRRWWRSRDELLVFAAVQPSAAFADAVTELVSGVSTLWGLVVSLNDALESGQSPDGALARARSAHGEALELARTVGAALRTELAAR